MGVCRKLKKHARLCNSSHVCRELYMLLCMLPFRDYSKTLFVLLYGVLACVHELMSVISVIFIASCCDNTGSVLQTHARTLVACTLNGSTRVTAGGKGGWGARRVGGWEGLIGLSPLPEPCTSVRCTNMCAIPLQGKNYQYVSVYNQTQQVVLLAAQELAAGDVYCSSMSTESRLPLGILALRV